jgi:predicted GNAT superfamily acetyltransferase
MTDEITIRELKTMPELNATVELQRAVWGMHDVEVSSPHTLKAIVHSGGAVLGAELKGALIGFCFGFAAPRDGELWLWSHMAAVHPDFQGRGIGYRLKQAQREWALTQGFRWMAWTFDPMQSGNANFNFNRLGVTARRYSVNHYGDMQDGLNAGLASDRLEAQWQLDEPPPSPTASVYAVRHFPHGEGRGVTPFDNVDVTKLVYLDEGGAIRRAQPESTGDLMYGIEIPANIAELKQQDIERAKQWQLHLREAMTDLLAAGYVVSGFLRLGDTGFYILSPTD